MRAVSVKPVGILVFPLLALIGEPKVFTRGKHEFCPSAACVITANPVPDFLPPHAVILAGSREESYLKENQVSGMQSSEAAPMGTFQVLGPSLANISV